MDIAVIAPHEDIKRKADSVIAAFGFPARTYLGDLREGVTMAQQALNDGAKIIISRGGTARRIRQQLGVQVIDIRASVQATLAYIHGHTTTGTRIALTGFRPFVSLAKQICDVLGRQYEVFEITDDVPIEAVFRQVVDWKPDVVVGDAVSVRLARQESLHYHLIDSTLETLHEAFEQAMIVLHNIQRHLASAEKLTAVLNCAQQGVLLINGEGLIEEINLYGLKLMNQPHELVVGRKLSELFASAELESTLESGREARNVLLTCNNTRLVINSVTMDPERAASDSPPLPPVHGRVILFQLLRQIQEAESSVRTKLLHKGFQARHVFEDIRHVSAAMAQLVAMAREYSRTTCNIMIQGETGTGKELFAQSIHNASPLRHGPFVAVNCGALPGSLLESELFGYAPGAFTGALRAGKEGLFELAHNGTLFLDEITEMDVFLQTRLLRAIQERAIMRVGDNKVIPVNVRLVAATNIAPDKAISAGRLRMDLFYRLNVLSLHLPPLRERREDILYLFRHYLQRYGARYGITPASPNPAQVRWLERHQWPGNVRELENLAEKTIVLQQMPETLPSLPPASTNDATDPVRTLDEIIRQSVLEALEIEQGNISRTARRLGIDRNTVKRWME